ncbi:hypothetical protein ONZ45_g10400 [Pleurotus djamor]|nr:hypothetical protein ONZ45_g10400 [Pleurotus djamor]
MAFTMSSYPSPVRGASLVLSFRLHNRTTIIIGGGQLAATRAFAALEADSIVVIITRGPPCDELCWREQQGQLTILDFDKLPSSSSGSSDDQILSEYLSQHPGANFVCVTDTITGSQRRSRHSASSIHRVCKAHNVLVNITDMPELCDFSFTSTHRFEDDSSGAKSALQIGVTTNGKGCRLAGRVKRDIIAHLPKDVGRAVSRVGELRELARERRPDVIEEEEEVEDNYVTTPNRPVPQRGGPESAADIARRYMKWVAQISEYWPIHKLATMSLADMERILSDDHPFASTSSVIPSIHSIPANKPKTGRILLVGSGPGHPSLLTVATHTALTKMADVVLSDKLVPSAVLDLIPSHVTIQIARKFPGNAEGAQNEMMEAALDAARKGLCVVRLKQGDPAIYGRFGEEVLFFRSHGIEPLVIPGVSSAIAAPTFAGIPVTQRGAAESLIVCTGVGRAGKNVVLPGYERGRTLVILMGVARLAQVVRTLTDPCSSEDGSRRDGPVYPSNLPIAIIERASMSDQRVITSTLRHIVRALDSCGEQRPPAMIVVGWSVLALWGEGDMGVLDSGYEEDDERVQRWLGRDSFWRVKEGLDEGWQYF